MDLLDKIENLKIGYSVPNKIYKKENSKFFLCKEEEENSKRCEQCYFYSENPLPECDYCCKNDYIYKEISEIEVLVLSDLKKEYYK